MRYLPLFLLLAGTLVLACKKDKTLPENPLQPALQLTKNVQHNGVAVDVVIDKPEGNRMDAVLLFHGTVRRDSLVLQAANQLLGRFKDILQRDDLLLISVAYPEENLLFGDNLAHCEAALLWVKQQAEAELGIQIPKIYLAGHSQGGYLAVRLNTLHSTAGVIANAPGPLNLVFRCQLEENGQIPPAMECSLLNQEYGSTSQNASAYFNRSLLNFTDGFKAPMLLVQGLNDGPIHMHSWPQFKQQVQDCVDCASVQIVEIEGAGHADMFDTESGRQALNQFIGP
ncbi:MAG: alpha/beta hydrolase family protein [Bacteroidia bacterium]